MARLQGTELDIVLVSAEGTLQVFFSKAFATAFVSTLIAYIERQFGLAADSAYFHVPRFVGFVAHAFEKFPQHDRPPWYV